MKLHFFVVFLNESPVWGGGVLPMRVSLNNNVPDNISMISMQFKIRIYISPTNVCRIIASLQFKLAHLCAILVVEIQRSSLHPSVVGITKIIHVAAIDVHTAVFEELLYHAALVGKIECLLREFPLECNTYILAGIDHATGNCPQFVVGTLYGHHLDNISV